jgi:hypothetical protein
MDNGEGGKERKREGWDGRPLFIVVILILII